MSTHALLVLSAVGSAEEASAFVPGLVEERLVACGTLLPGAASVYRWEGTITEEQEVMVLLKTDVSKWDELSAAVLERHPYEVPELLAFPVEHAPDLYLSWLTNEVVA